jgi:hypothetical protein
VKNWFQAFAFKCNLRRYVEAISPIKPYTIWSPLVLVVGLSMAKEAVEDYARHQQVGLALFGNFTFASQENTFILTQTCCLHPAGASPPCAFPHPFPPPPCYCLRLLLLLLVVFLLLLLLLLLLMVLVTNLAPGSEQPEHRR